MKLTRRSFIYLCAAGAAALSRRADPASAHDAPPGARGCGPRAVGTRQADRIKFEDIARLPAPGMDAPSAVQFSPDGRLITYLYSGASSLVQELWAYEPASGREWRLLDVSEDARPSEADFSFAEAMKRERLRQYTLGVTEHAWSDDGTSLLARRQGEVLVRSGADGPWRVLPGSRDWADPQLSPDGTRVAFVREGELHVIDLEEGASPRRLTFDAATPGIYGDQPVTNGLAEYVAQEELGRLSGYWWAPDGRRIVFEQAENTDVPLHLIPHPATAGVEVEAHRYPTAGAPNTCVRLGIVPVAGGDVTWLSLGDDPDIYLARVDWTPDDQLVVQLLARDQQHLTLRRVDPVTGAGSTLWVERVEPWVNVSDDLRFIRRSGSAADEYSVLWSSERTGWRELYLYDRDGGPLRQLTDRAAYVDGVAGLDVAGGWVYFHGWAATPLERQFFRVPLAGGRVEQLTRAPGTHRCRLAPDRRAFVDAFDAVDSPPVVALHDLAGNETGRLQAAAPPDPLTRDLDLSPPEFVQVTSRDGVTLHGALYRPRGLAPGAKAPVIVSVYGGPGIQRVVNGWTMTADLRAQYLAQEGCAVFTLDNRGTARRGLAFEAAVDRNLGDLEVRDQVDGVRWLATQVPEADTGRVGVYGWSYGGYMALMCLARAPEVFTAAAAGGPVTAWDGYDTTYTERYMGRPQDNPDGYRHSAVLTHAPDIRGPLLLIHGLIDENVHFRHTARLLAVLVPAGIAHELLLFPQERHHVRREEHRVTLERRIATFFQRHLLGSPAYGTTMNRAPTKPTVTNLQRGN